MAVPMYSPEGRMIEKLRNLNCAESSFAKLVVGIAGKTRIAEAFKDSAKAFPAEIADRLLERVSQMEELQAAVAPIPIAWERTEEIRNALATRLAWRIQVELGIPDDLSHAADWATKQVTR